jgi:hypothetical protein
LLRSRAVKLYSRQIESGGYIFDQEEGLSNAPQTLPLASDPVEVWLVLLLLQFTQGMNESAKSSSSPMVSPTKIFHSTAGKSL